MEQYAYIRVSTKEQNVERQIFALEPYHIPKKNIYCDYQSGKDFERPAYQKLLKKLKAGDLMIVKSIDRLGRNYNDILIQWQYITKEIKADILVLDMELLDTRKKSGTLFDQRDIEFSWEIISLEQEKVKPSSQDRGRPSFYRNTPRRNRPL